MIQFFGIHLSSEEVAVVVLGRDLRLTTSMSTRVMNTTREPATGIVEVPVAEWTRAGAFAIQEAYFRLAVADRKPWGLGLAGPSGWVALDVEFEPISPLRITGEASVEEDLRRWISQNPRLARRVTVILSPKDYFRFTLSRGLAADVTTASRLGILQPSSAQWSESRAAEAGIPVDWLPPTFDSVVTTGMLSEEGMRQTSLPSGVWLVAGAHEREAEIAAAGDARDRRLLGVSRARGPWILAYGVHHLLELEPPAGWRAVRSHVAGEQLLEREVDAPGEGEAGAADRILLEARSQIEASGREVTAASWKQTSPGSAAAGAAAMAAVGSGMVKGWDVYYRKRPENQDTPCFDAI